MTAKMLEEIFGVIKCSKIGCGDAQFYQLTKNYWIVHVQESHFMICKYYLNKFPITSIIFNENDIKEKKYVNKNCVYSNIDHVIPVWFAGEGKGHGVFMGE